MRDKVPGREFGKWITAALLGLAVLVSPTRAAAPIRGVIELFTSQGCATCPPADALLAEMADDPDLITLSFSVDYWDYIGWKDSFADPAYTARQKAYAKARGDGQVYTPQAVVDGVTHVVGSDRTEIAGALTASARKRGAMTVPVTITKADSKMLIDVAAAAPGTPRAASVWLVDTIPSKTVAIGRGENRGRAVTYTNIVRRVSKLGEWSGNASQFELVRRLGDNNYVILLQANDPGPGPILGAAKWPL